MTMIRNAALAFALLAAAPSYGQTAQDQAPSAGKETGMMGGTGPGPMMGGQHPGMMGPDGMMGGPMMENMRRMMGMMSMMGAGMRPGAQHIEGRLAFLKTELKITDAQAPQWDAFADAVRANAKAMGDTHRQAMSQGGPKTLPERLAFERQAMTAHLDALDRTTGALDKLYDVLSADQKKIADEIVVGPMGMPIGMM